MKRLQFSFCAMCGVADVVQGFPRRRTFLLLILFCTASVPAMASMFQGTLSFSLKRVFRLS